MRTKNRALITQNPFTFDPLKIQTRNRKKNSETYIYIYRSVQIRTTRNGTFAGGGHIENSYRCDVYVDGPIFEEEFESAIRIDRNRHNLELHGGFTFCESKVGAKGALNSRMWRFHKIWKTPSYSARKVDFPSIRITYYPHANGVVERSMIRQMSRSPFINAQKCVVLIWPERYIYIYISHWVFFSSWLSKNKCEIFLRDIKRMFEGQTSELSTLFDVLFHEVLSVLIKMITCLWYLITKSPFAPFSVYLGASN